MHQVSKPRAANQSITEESGRPGTFRSKVGCEAIDEPWTNSTVPRFGPAEACGFCHRNSFTSPFLVQCSLPETALRAAVAWSTSIPLEKSAKERNFISGAVEQDQLDRGVGRGAQGDLAPPAQHDAVAPQQHLAVALDGDVGSVGG